MLKFYLPLARYLTFIVVLVAGTAWSQTRTITGVVKSADDDNPIPGVNVVEKGTSNGTATGIDGSYSINVNENATLVYTFVGYKTQEVPVGAQSNINVTLQADVTALSEVVVIGYGEVQRRDATGAVASVKSEEFNRGIISSPEQLIQGKMAGVQITSASGEPGAGVNMRIRGTSSVRGGNNPLFVVDGIPLTGADVTAGGPDIGRGTSTAKNPLNFLNPNDIESIDVLKDASATAIYGSRGANGVVIITTKSGKGRKNQLEYSNTLSLSTMANRYDLLDREQFLSGAQQLGVNISEIDEGNDTDWQKEISRTSFSHRHDLSYANNYKSGNYRVAVAYDNQQGVIKNTGMERLTGRLNLNHNFLDDKLQFGTQLTFSRVNDEAALITDNAGFEGTLLGAAYMANPTWSTDPEIQLSNTNANPNSLLKYFQDNTRTNRALINVSLAYNITEALNFKINTGFDRSDSRRGQAFSSALNLNGGIAGNGRAAILDVETGSDLLEAFFNYSKSVGRGELSAVLGYSYQEFIRNGVTTLGLGFPDENMDTMLGHLKSSAAILGGSVGQRYQQFGYDDVVGDNPADFFINKLFPTPETISDLPRPAGVTVRAVSQDIFDTVDELQSFFGRVNYNLSEKYLFTVTFRADGSTKFGGNNKYGFFPSGAFAWRLSEEGFIPDAFEDLKLRIGYGVTGNQEIPHNLHQRRQRFNGIGPNNDGVVNNPGLGTVAFDNDELKWEQTSQTNIGLDFGLARGRISGSIDYYRKVTTDLLIQITSAQPAPQPFTWQNLDADVINSGIELTLNYFAMDTDEMGLDFGFNISFNDNVVENFNGVVNTGVINGQGLTGAFAQRIVEGQPLYSFFLREFTGYDESGISTYNGDFQRFLNKSPIPKVNLGLSIGYRLNNFDASIYFAGQFGHYVYNNTANAYFTAGSLGNSRNVIQDVLGSGESNLNAPDVSTRFLEKGDFLRIQNLNLGYNFPMEEDSFIKRIRIAASAQNLFVFTNYSGLDPEVNVNKQMNDVPSLGIDYGGYPRARTFSLGLSATF